jgi:hypothetical protein
LKLLGSKPVAGSSLNSALECNRASKINVLVEGGGFWGIFSLHMMCSDGLFPLIHSHTSSIYIARFTNMDVFISPQSSYLAHVECSGEYAFCLLGKRTRNYLHVTNIINIQWFLLDHFTGRWKGYENLYQFYLANTNQKALIFSAYIGSPLSLGD